MRSPLASRKPPDRSLEPAAGRPQAPDRSLEPAAGLPG